MITIVTAVFLFGILLVQAGRANARFRVEDRLPMQWWINGDVTWWAPRFVALAFIPALAIPVFASLIFLPPRPGQEGLVFPALIGIGATFIGIQILHVWLIAKTLGRNVR